ncbi:proline iminopeptidase-family hydrolase [Streptomyces sp. NPDC005283]|uniref:proline iminopeptidase-family hydrolase n=1 Tax=Streptomyces sp. NPDC005283 TaxID=3156871 RepID=UPI00345297F2
MALAPSARGTVAFGPYRTWYRVTGDRTSARPTVVLVHGGPGSTHDYLLSLAALAEHGWPVVHYDQIGNGGSTHLPHAGADFWTVQLFLDELDNLVRSLGIADNFVLFGQSWGGMLSSAYAAGRPKGLRGLVVANSPASYPLWAEELAVLRAQLPPGVNEALLAHEKAGTTDTPDYLDAMNVFYDRHVLRLPSKPLELTASLMEIANDPTVYFTMNGPSEFHVVGTLRDWSVIDLLPRIEAPTLLMSGRHDEVTVGAVQPYFDLIPDVRWEVFEESSHGPHLEEPALFMKVLVEYLRSLD